jgi:hypothetical protein
METGEIANCGSGCELRSKGLEKHFIDWQVRAIGARQALLDSVCSPLYDPRPI